MLLEAAFVAGHINVLSLSVCLWNRCSALLTAGPAKGKAAAVFSSLGRDPRSLSSAGLQWLDWSGAGLEWLQKAFVLFALYLP